MMYAVPAPDQNERFYNFKQHQYTKLSQHCLLPSQELAQMYSFVIDPNNQEDDFKPQVHPLYIRSKDGFALFREEGDFYDFTTSQFVGLEHVGLLPSPDTITDAYEDALHLHRYNIGLMFTLYIDDDMRQRLRSQPVQDLTTAIQQLRTQTVLQASKLRLLEKYRILLMLLLQFPISEVARILNPKPTVIQSVWNAWQQEQKLPEDPYSGRGLHVEFDGKGYTSRLQLCHAFGITTHMIYSLQQSYPHVSFLRLFEVTTAFLAKLEGKRPPLISHMPAVIYNDVWYDTIASFCKACQLPERSFMQFRTKFIDDANRLDPLCMMKKISQRSDMKTRHKKFTFEPSGYCRSVGLEFRQYLNAVLSSPEAT